MTNALIRSHSVVNKEGEIVPERLLRYLTRSVNNICYASEEEQYAAALIIQLQAEIAGLKDEVVTLREQNQTINTMVRTDHGDIDYSTEKEIDILRAAYKRDGLRLAFCLQESLYSDGNYIVGNFEHEQVVEGDYRAAIDRIMGD